jgi:hypothetical protein
MIVILYQDGCENVATNIQRDLIRAFSDRVAVDLAAAAGATSWSLEPSWDDLLVVVFDATEFPASGKAFIERYVTQRPETGMILPVAMDEHASKPPGAASAIKALRYDAAAEGPSGKCTNRVGGMLGLRVQGRDCRIFISYRAVDGSKIAKQIHSHLTSLGHRAYLDEAKEFDGEPNIRPGSPVQSEIDAALDRANLVLLVDTPAAPNSEWIKHEVNTADGLLLPILPLCFREKSDKKIGPRFPSLVALQRWVTLQTPDAVAHEPLTESQLDLIVDEVETYLCEIFRRKCRVPFLVEKEFLSHGFAWKVLDRRLLMFESSKSMSSRVRTKVLSHCSVFDPIYNPALKRFGEFLKATSRCNYSLFIYDGELLAEPVLDGIVAEQSEPVIILHHQELATLIDSNFTTVGPV